jgi:hypothetical protein
MNIPTQAKTGLEWATVVEWVIIRKAPLLENREKRGILSDLTDVIRSSLSEASPSAWVWLWT